MSAKKTVGKKLLCILLSFAMLLCMTPTMAFAAEKVGEAVSASVDITAQAEGSFLMAPQKDASVSEDLAESYGYKDQVSGGVSALDALVRAHEVMFGGDFNKDTAKNYLVVSEQGWVQVVFGMETSAFNFAVNGDYPYDPDSSYSSQTGYTGYLITTAPIKDGGSVEFFINRDQDMYCDFYSYFEQNGKRVTEIEANAGQETELNVQGYIFAFGGPFKGEDRVNQGALGGMAGAKLATVNMETGEITEIGGRRQTMKALSR